MVSNSHFYQQLETVSQYRLSRRTYNQSLSGVTSEKQTMKYLCIYILCSGDSREIAYAPVIPDCSIKDNNWF